MPATPESKVHEPAPVNSSTQLAATAGNVDLSQCLLHVCHDTTVKLDAERIWDATLGEEEEGWRTSFCFLASRVL